MATHTLDIAAFREAFAQFADDTAYPDAYLQIWFGIATGYVSANDSWIGLCGPVLQSALNLMLAHLLTMAGPATGGGGSGGGIVTESTVDKVSVTLEAPPVNSAWDWWLLQTPMGAALLALLKAQGAGGLYIGGLPEQSAFRRVGGGFGRFGFR